MLRNIELDDHHHSRSNSSRQKDKKSSGLFGSIKSKIKKVTSSGSSNSHNHQHSSSSHRSSLSGSHGHSHHTSSSHGRRHGSHHGTGHGSSGNVKRSTSILGGVTRRKTTEIKLSSADLDDTVRKMVTHNSQKLNALQAIKSKKLFGDSGNSTGSAAEEDRDEENNSHQSHGIFGKKTIGKGKKLFKTGLESKLSGGDNNDHNNRRGSLDDSNLPMRHRPNLGQTNGNSGSILDKYIAKQRNNAWTQGKDALKKAKEQRSGSIKSTDNNNNRRNSLRKPDLDTSESENDDNYTESSESQSTSSDEVSGEVSSDDPDSVKSRHNFYSEPNKTDDDDEDSVNSIEDSLEIKKERLRRSGSGNSSINSRNSSIKSNQNNKNSLKKRRSIDDQIDNNKFVAGNSIQAALNRRMGKGPTHVAGASLAEALKGQKINIPDMDDEDDEYNVHLESDFQTDPDDSDTAKEDDGNGTNKKKKHINKDKNATDPDNLDDLNDGSGISHDEYRDEFGSLKPDLETIVEESGEESNPNTPNLNKKKKSGDLHKNMMKQKIEANKKGASDHHHHHQQQGSPKKSPKKEQARKKPVTPEEKEQEASIYHSSIYQGVEDEPLDNARHRLKSLLGQQKTKCHLPNTDKNPYTGPKEETNKLSFSGKKPLEKSHSDHHSGKNFIRSWQQKVENNLMGQSNSEENANQSAAWASQNQGAGLGPTANNNTPGQENGQQNFNYQKQTQNSYIKQQEAAQAKLMEHWHQKQNQSYNVNQNNANPVAAPEIGQISPQGSLNQAPVPSTTVTAPAPQNPLNVTNPNAGLAPNPVGQTSALAFNPNMMMTAQQHLQYTQAMAQQSLTPQAAQQMIFEQQNQQNPNANFEQEFGGNPVDNSGPSSLLQPSNSIKKKKKKSSKNQINENVEYIDEDGNILTAKKSSRKKKNSLKKKKSKNLKEEQQQQHLAANDQATDQPIYVDENGNPVDPKTIEKFQKLTDLVGLEAAQQIMEQGADQIVMENEEGMQIYQIDENGDFHLMDNMDGPDMINSRNEENLSSTATIMNESSPYETDVGSSIMSSGAGASPNVYLSDPALQGGFTTANQQTTSTPTKTSKKKTGKKNSKKAALQAQNSVEGSALDNINAILTEGKSKKKSSKKKNKNGN